MILGVTMVVAASAVSRSHAGFSWRHLLKACPQPFRLGAIAFMAYGLFNVFLLWTQQIPDLQGLSAIWQCAYASIAVVYYVLGRQPSD